MRERHGREWQPAESQALKEALARGQSIANVALSLGRSERAIRIRARRLGVILAPEPRTSSSLAPEVVRPESHKLPRDPVYSAFNSEDPDDAGDPLPDRLRAAVVAVIRACVSDPRRRAIAFQVLGLRSDDEPITMATVARAMSLSRERIRQLRNSVFSRITANRASRIAPFARLRRVLGDISAETHWEDPADAAPWTVKLATDNFGAASMFTYVICRAGGSTAPTRDLRQQCATAARAASKESDQRASWRFDRWADALTRALFRTVARFDSPPTDLIGAKRTPGNPDRDHDFISQRLGRTVACESPTEARVYRWLERSADVRWYQEQPAKLTYKLEGVILPYFPDCAVLGTDGRMVVVEVKPIFGMYRYKTLAKAIAALNHYGSRGIGYLLVDDSGRTLDDVGAHPFPQDVAERIEALFHDGPVRFDVIRNEFARHLERFDFATFASMVVNRDWGVTDGPGVRVFKLRDGLSFRALRLEVTSSGVNLRAPRR